MKKRVIKIGNAMILCLISLTFVSCFSLTTMQDSNGYNHYIEEDDVLYKVKKDRKEATVIGWSSNKTSLDIPSRVYNGYTVVGIEYDSYGIRSLASRYGTRLNCYNERRYKIRTVSLPSSIRYLGYGAFQDCSNLESVDLQNTAISEVGSSAFEGCSELKSIILPLKLKEISKSAFDDCYKLRSIELPSSITHIGDGAFKGCYGVKNITIPSSVTYIGDEAFKGCYGVKNITIPSSVTYIGDEAFANCGIESITIPSTSTEVKRKAFVGCKLKKVNIPLSIASQLELPYGCKNIHPSADTYKWTQVSGQRLYDGDFTFPGIGNGDAKYQYYENKDGSRNFDGHFRFRNSYGEIEGDLKDNKQVGKWTMKMRNGNYMIMEFSNGEPCGEFMIKNRGVYATGKILGGYIYNIGETRKSRYNYISYLDISLSNIETPKQADKINVNAKGSFKLGNYNWHPYGEWKLKLSNVKRGADTYFRNFNLPELEKYNSHVSSAYWMYYDDSIGETITENVFYPSTTYSHTDFMELVYDIVSKNLNSMVFRSSQTLGFVYNKR